METTIVNWCYMGIKEKKMETDIGRASFLSFWGFGLGSGLARFFGRVPQVMGLVPPQRLSVPPPLLPFCLNRCSSTPVRMLRGTEGG